jgi:hypothetical protein
MGEVVLMTMRRLTARHLISAALICCTMTIAMLRAESTEAQDRENTYRDDLERQMAWSLMDEDFEFYMDLLYEYLDMDGAYVPDMIYYHAMSLEKTGFVFFADDTLDEFLDSVSEAHPRYGDALALRAAIQPRLD